MKRTPLKPVSDKRAAENVQRKAMVAFILASRPSCELRKPGCTLLAAHVHEPLTRARGGSIIDAENTLALCTFCHSWVHANPLEASSVGALRRRCRLENHDWEWREPATITARWFAGYYCTACGLPDPARPPEPEPPSPFDDPF